MIVDSLDIHPDEFARETGWELKPEGACNGDACVPLGDARTIEAVTDRLGMAVVRDEAEGLWAIGPPSLGGRALATAQVPELVLPDLDARPFALSSLRGQKVVLVAWAPY